ncbi:MAG: biotin/lipoyl-binding protein [Lachnospiraceae bacterium]|nr:biotin/lipoyl-binding protein [Lachnospiraceae bacterium]
MPEKEKRKSGLAPVMVGRGLLLLLTAALILLAALLYWFVFGMFKTSFSTEGVLTTEDDAILIHYPQDAIVTEICVKENQFVREGDVLLKVFPKNDEENLSLEQMMSRSDDVVSPFDGFVTEVMIRRWEQSNISTPLAGVMAAENDNVSHVLSYVTVDYANMISRGTDVNITVKGAPENSEGLLHGKVLTVSELPVTEYQMHLSSGSGRVSEAFYESDKDQYEVLIGIDMDEYNSRVEAGSEIRESSLVCNEVCEVTYFSDEMHPYQVIFDE